MSTKFVNPVDVVKFLNVQDMSVVVLTKIIRKHYGLTLTDSLNMARLMKEIHHLGIVRGQVINK
jgi:hypothetical protein